MAKFAPKSAENVFREAMLETVAVLEKRVGKLTSTSKMVWLSYSLPPHACRTGSKLRSVPGSVCSKCYACTGFYHMPVVKAAQDRRLELVRGDLSQWAGNMEALITKKAERVDPDRRYFRWHDSGDIQSVAHANAIAWIATVVPSVQFYCPTKESAYVRRDRLYFNPYNLVIRYSAPMVGMKPDGLGPHSATVDSGEGYPCPAGKDGRDYACGDCRACWNATIGNIDYALH